MIAIINCDDSEGYQIEYYIDVIKVDKCLSESAHGQYIPSRHRNGDVPQIQLSRTRKPFTLEHECLHATIDFIRTTQNVEFNDLFNVGDPFGEEAFIYYYESILEACKKALGE